MNRQKRTLYTILSLLGAAVLIAACVPLPGTMPAAPPTSTPWPPLDQAQLALAEALEIAPEAVTFVSSEPVEWTDACLGLAAHDEMCAQVITPGYRIVLAADGQQHVVHTDAAGDQARVAEPNAGASLPEAALAAQRVLSEQLGVELSSIRIISVVAVEWRDGCLGLAAPDEMCTMAIVPGYQVILEVDGQQFMLHTNASGSQVRAANLPAPENLVPPAALQARAGLADTLQLAPEAVRIISTEAVEWPDACLGAPQPDEVCAQVVTPGYKVLLGTGETQYECRTDQTGDNLRLLPEPVGTGPIRITWRGQGAAECIEARFSLETLAYGPCGNIGAPVALSGKRNWQSQMAGLLATYGPFAASTPGGTLSFTGLGRFQATAAEQRMIAEWAARAVTEASDKQGLTMWGLGWHREGGVAGFCDDLTIDATGYAELAPCKYETPQEVIIRNLTADELAQFYGWLDTLAPFEFAQQDTATADGLTVRYIFAGRGAREATDADKQALAEFSREVLARWPGPIEVQNIQALADVTIYAGPGTQYPARGQMLAGQTALNTGILPDQSWWRVMCPDKTFGNCWVSADPQMTRPVEQ